MAINRNIRSISYITIGLILGKFAGFFKHFTIVKLFGLNYQTDAFFIANTISEMTINILIAGLLSGALIPILSEILVKYGNRKFSEFVSSSFLVIGGVLFLIAIALYIFSYKIGVIIAPGFTEIQYVLLSKIFKILSPGVLFIGLAAVLRGAMHVLEDFLAPSLGLFIANSTTIVIAFLFYNKWGILSVAVGTSLGFFLWFLIHLPFTIKYLSFGNMIHFFDNYLVKLIKFSIPAIAIIFLSNVTLVIEKIVASRFTEGTISELNLAFRLALIFSIILITPLSILLLPKLSKQFGKDNFNRIFDITKKSLKFATVILFPFLVVVLFNGSLLTSLVYGLIGISKNELSNISTYLIMYSFAIGTLFFYTILLKLFYAIQQVNQLVAANILGLVSYLIAIILFTNSLKSYILPIAYWAYSVAVVIYLFYILKCKIFLEYSALLNQKILLFGILFFAFSVLVKYYFVSIQVNNILSLLVSLLLIFFFLLTLSKKKLFDLKMIRKFK